MAAELEALWSLITALGDLRAWLLFMLFLGIYAAINRHKLSKHNRRALLVLLVTLIAVSFAAQALKMTVNAPRICTPCPADGCNPYCPTDDPYAFPSGHAALAFAMFTAGWVVFPRNNKERIEWAWVFALPVLIAASRLALGVHTPEQVAAGALLGIAVAAVVLLALRKSF